MGKPETDLAVRIRDKTLELLMEKEPEEISIRDIAKACGVTATSLYYYYRDREAVFDGVKFHCIEKMDKFISARVAKAGKKYRPHARYGKEPPSPLLEFRAGFNAFRDWSFANPRIALLVMGRFRADVNAEPGQMSKYYRSTVFAKTMLDKAVKTGFSGSKDTMLDANLSIAALWGSIEMVLLKRTIPQYWSRKGSVVFTNKMIDLLLASLMQERDKK